MKKLLLVIAMTIGYYFAYGQINREFYYAFEQKIYLNPVPEKFIVEFINQADESVLRSNSLSFKQVAPGMYEVRGDENRIQRAGEGVYHMRPAYTTDDGLPMQMRSSINLRWRDGVSAPQKSDLIRQHGLTLVKSARLYDQYQTADPLPISRLIFESGLVRYCVPAFIAPVEKLEHIPNDPYFANQFYLHNTGQTLNDGHTGTADADIDMPDAWDITFGDPGVVIAIVDEGVTGDHFDLPNSRQLRLPGSNIAAPFDGSNPDDPEPTGNENHGNSCAGVAAATIDNNEGIAGVAPNCTVMPVKVRYGIGLGWVDFADAVSFAADNGATVISNSWGAGTSLNNISPEMITAIEDAIDQGSVVVFAAGNTANHAAGSDGFVGFPGNANIPELITVGASDRNDDQANYSPTDDEFDISAPSHTAYNNQIPGEAFNVWTIDIHGDNGYNSWHETWTAPLPAVGETLPSTGPNFLAYTGRFGGTSAATPQVAAVVALMLSENNCLSINQVMDILYNSAEAVGGYDYSSDPDNPGRSRELGHGRLNAFNAVHAASESFNAGLDLYTKDVDDDFGLEPNETDQFIWESVDIWVRNQPDGLTNHEHQNPEYSASVPVYVYVRVRNIGCAPSLGTEALNAYWSKAATALTWPQYWDGSITVPALMGAPIGAQTIPVIQPGEDTILEFEWMVPNPADYEDINDQPWHFCLLSRIVATNDPMFDEQWTGTWNLGYNVRYNNNIAWKNLTVVDLIPGIGGGGWPDDVLVGGTVAVGNATDTEGVFDLVFETPKHEYGNPILDEAEVRVILDEKTWQKWLDGRQVATNLSIYRADRRILRVTGNPASLGNLTYAPHERSLIDLSFNFLTECLSGKPAFGYYVYQTTPTAVESLGGEKYQIQLHDRPFFTANAGADQKIILGDETTLSAAGIGEDAVYNWYDPAGALVGSAQEITVRPVTTTVYKLETIAKSDGYKDYDDVEVRVELAGIRQLAPNPASSYVTVYYNAQNVSSAYLLLGPSGAATAPDLFTLNTSQTQITLNLSTYTPGVYTISMITDGNLVDQETLIID